MGLCHHCNFYSLFLSMRLPHNVRAKFVPGLQVRPLLYCQLHHFIAFLRVSTRLPENWTSQIMLLSGLSRAQAPSVYGFSLVPCRLRKNPINSCNYALPYPLLIFHPASTIVYHKRPLATHNLLFYQHNAKVHDIGIGRASDQQVIEVLKKMI